MREKSVGFRTMKQMIGITETIREREQEQQSKRKDMLQPTPRELDALAIVRKSGTVLATQVAQELGVTRNRANELLRRLVMRGMLVSRNSHQNHNETAYDVP